MPSNVDIGNQKISFDFKQPAKGSEFTRLLFSVVKPGIYKGLDVSIASGTQIDVTPGHAFLNCLYQSQTTRTATVEFVTGFSLNIPRLYVGQNQIVYLYYEYAEVTENYVQILNINSGSSASIPTNAIILCEVIYDTLGNINGIIYDKRSYGLYDYDSGYSLPDINLKFSNYIDKTKKFRFNASNVTSNQTRIMGLPDYDYNIGSVDDWTSSRKYNVKELVLYNRTLYRCKTSHTSSSDFFSDLSQWENITEIQNEERTRVYSATGVSAGKVVTIVGDYPAQQIPSVSTLSSFSQDPFGLSVSSISAGGVGDVIQRGRLVVSSFNTSSGYIGQKVYSDSSGNLTLTVTSIEIGQLITPSVSGTVIYASIVPTAEGIDPINFNGQLSTSEDTIQKAFDRIDDFGYIPTWSSGLGYRLNNTVNYNGNTYRCTSAHTSTSTFDLTKWTIDQTLITDKFTGQLRPVENTIQSAFDRLDDFGYIPVWASGQVYRVSNAVIQNSVIYRCIISHTSSTSFTSDVSNWTQVNEAPIIPQDSNTYYAGDKVFRTVQKEQVEGIKLTQIPQFSGVRVNELDFATITNESASGSILALTSNNRSVIRLTGTNVTINGIQAPTGTFAQYVAISNVTGGNIIINNESSLASTVNRVLTGVSNAITIPNDTTITLLYDFVSFRWRISGGAVSNHNLLFNLQGGDGTNFYHSDQPINRANDVVFNSVTIKTGSSASGSTIVNGVSAPNRSPGVSGNIGLTYMQTNGIKWTKVGTSNTDWRADWIGDLTNEQTGFPVGADGEVDRTSSTLTFNTASRTLTIAPTSGSYSIIIKGKEIVKTSSESVTILASSGLYYVYFDETGTLTYSTSFTLNIIYKFVYVATIYWSSTQGQATHIGDERHGCVMDAHTHARFHQTQGAVFISGSGLGAFNIDGTGTSNADTQFSIGSGFIRDEDILHTLSQKFAIDSIPVLYRSNTEWLRVTNANQKFHYNTRAYYNSNVSGNYSLTEVTNNNFCLYHIVATNDINNPYFSLMGLNEYTNKSAARAGAITEVSQFSGLPFQEFVFIATVIFESKDSYTNTGKSRIVTTDTGANYVDWRFTSTLNPSTANVNNHNNLGGLQGGLGGNFYHSNQPINTTDSVSFNGVTSTSVNSGTITSGSLNVTGTSSLNNVVVSGNLNVSGTSNLSSSNLGNTTVNGTINVTGTSTLRTTNVIGNISASGVVSNTLKVSNINYPIADGTNGQAIVTDGAGNLSFQTVNGGGGGGSSSPSTSFSTTVSFPIGSPIYFGASGWTLAIANSDIATGQYVISTISASGGVYTYTAVALGEVTLTTAQWDVITGGSGGLTSGTQYYVSSLYSGKISTTPGVLYAPVLKALSSTKAFVSFAITNTESGMGDTFYRDTTITTGTTTAITLTYPPSGKAYVWLTIDGVTQSGSDFSLAGTTLTLGGSVPSGTLIDVVYARAILLADAGAINRMVSFSETVSGSAKTIFNLPTVPSGVNSAIVFVGGAIQDSTKFNIVGNLLYLSDPVPVGSRVVAYILNSSGTVSTIDSFVTRQTWTLNNSSTVSLSTIFGSQVSALYRIFDITDPRISANIYLKQNGVSIDPDVRVDSNSSMVSITQNTASKLNIYIASNSLTFQNLTGSSLNLRLYREI